MGQTYKDAGGRPSRSRSRSSVASRSHSASPASAGGRGSTRARSSGARWAETSTASRASGAAPTTTPASPRATRATWSSGRRSTCAAPGAHLGVDRRLRKKTRRAVKHFQRKHRLQRRRQDRPANLASPTEGQARHGRLVEQAAPPLRQAGARPRWPRVRAISRGAIRDPADRGAHWAMSRAGGSKAARAFLALISSVLQNERALRAESEQQAERECAAPGLAARAPGAARAAGAATARDRRSAARPRGPGGGRGGGMRVAWTAA